MIKCTETPNELFIKPYLLALMSIRILTKRLNSRCFNELIILDVLMNK